MSRIGHDISTHDWAGVLVAGTLAGSCLTTPLGNPLGPTSCWLLLGLAASDCGDLKARKKRFAAVGEKPPPQECSPVLVTENPVERDSSYSTEGISSFATNANGTVMAFSRFFGSEGRGVFVTNLLTGDEKRMSDLGECNHVSLDNAGDRIAFGCRTAEARQVFVKDVATGVTLLYRDGPYGVVMQPFLSGSGSSLFYVRAAEESSPWGSEVVREKVDGHGVPEVVSVSGALVSGCNPVSNEEGDLCLFNSNTLGLNPAVVSPSPGQLYLKNLATGSVTLVSATSQGIPAQDGFSLALGIVEGGVVVFESTASNFPEGGGDDKIQSFVYAKKVGGELTLLSRDAQGSPVAGISHAVTRDGRFLTFAPSPSSPDFQGPFFVDIKDVETGNLHRIEGATAGTLTPDGSAFIYTSPPYDKRIGTNQTFVSPLYRLATRCFLEE